MVVSSNGDGQGVVIDTAGLQLHQVALAGKFLYHILPGGQAGPGLDAYIGCIGVGPVPNPKVGHLGIGNGNAVARSAGSQSHFPGHILENDGVLVK
jgi:hypothetical protein